MEQPGRLEHSDVPRCGWPRVLEHLGTLAGGHRPALEVQRKQDPPAGRVGERREHRLVRIHPSLPLLSRSASGHALHIFSTQAKYCQGKFSAWAKYQKVRREMTSACRRREAFDTRK